MAVRTEIKPLADHVIDQIAAGEIVERPASIVKELLENSLDAGASRITVELEAGGVERIVVRDDGAGIAPDQLPRAVLRHYTSKLSSAEELEAIGSLGFRGEALASIASVAEFSITSRAPGAAHGFRLELLPGQTAATTPEAAPHPPGTTVEVRRLFATVPARRHFLKRPRTELLHIQQLVRRAGFCYPEVALRLVHDGQQKLSLPAVHEAGAADRRWRALFGAEFCTRRLAVDEHTEGLRVYGWVGAADFSRQNADLQYIAVNGRIIRDRNVAHAIRMAYGEQLPPGRHAAYAVHLAMPAHAVDVNVHPGKAEVRFRDVRTVHDFVYSAVARTLAQTGERRDESYPPVARARRTTGIAEASPRRAASVSLPPSTPVSASAVSLAAVAYDRFAIVERDGHLYASDVVAAIEALVGARLARGECTSRPLIIPETIKGTRTEAELGTLASLGVDLHEFGDETLVLRGLPVVTSHLDAAAFVAALMRRLDAGAAAAAAVAASAAEAFRAPPGIAERRAWFDALTHGLAELGIAESAFTLEIGAGALAALFESERGGS